MEMLKANCVNLDHSLLNNYEYEMKFELNLTKCTSRRYVYA